MWMQIKIESPSGVWERWLACEGEPPAQITLDESTAIMLQGWEYSLPPGIDARLEIKATFGARPLARGNLDDTLLAHGFQREKAPE